ncbi:MAG TPA: hypothetical protein VGD08_09855 [Stellaceae bacterium]
MRIQPQNVGLPASTLTLLQARTASGAGGASGAAGAAGVAAPRRIAAAPAVSGIGSGQQPQGDRPAPSSTRLNAHAVERPLPPSSDRPPPRGSLVDILA